MSKENMKTVEGFPKLTQAQLKELEDLRTMPDSAIDTSDIPEWTEQDFADAIRLNGRSLQDVMKHYKVRKAPITARIDLDVLEWLKGQGEGYQTRLNTILRAAMINDLRQHHIHK